MPTEPRLSLPADDGYARIWQTYFDAHPRPHNPDGCLYCRGILTTAKSIEMVANGMSRPTGRKPSCAK